jgi:hypothetical protein
VGVKSKKPSLIRDPADWARDWGWVSPVRTKRAADRLRSLAEGLRDTYGEDDKWAGELIGVAAYLEKSTRSTASARRKRLEEVLR